jgi:mRNA-decapping enzyme subunit 2
LNDVFIYPPSKANAEEWFIEVDSNSATDLMKHLRKHKLRSKFQLTKVEPGQKGVFFGWPGTVEDVEVDGRLNDTGRTGGKDPRPGIGTRWLDETGGKSSFVKHLENNGVSEATLDQYTVHRMTNGFAEGQAEIITSSALPQESNIDLFGGIDFFKGCYLGQELTIRTHHTGVVRKRILPVQLYTADNKPEAGQSLPEYNSKFSLNLPPSESNISKLNTRGRGRSSGKWLTGIGNIGLALCRLEMMTDIQLTADRTNYDPSEEYKVVWEVEGQDQQEVMLKPFVPKWLRDGVEQSLRRKEKKAKPKPREELEEEDDDVN